VPPFVEEGSWVPIKYNVAWAEAYLHTKWHLDPSNRLATIHQRYRQDRQDMGEKHRATVCRANRFTNGRPKTVTWLATTWRRAVMAVLSSDDVSRQTTSYACSRADVEGRSSLTQKCFARGHFQEPVMFSAVLSSVSFPSCTVRKVADVTYCVVRQPVYGSGSSNDDCG